MNDSAPSCLIGIDGGGTACRFALDDGHRRVDVTSGPANASTDRAGTVATLRDGILALIDRAGLPVSVLATARLHAGLAGVMTSTIGQRIATELPVPNAVVTDDRPTTLAGALGHKDGILAAIGTGSFFARQSGDQRHFVGGWGFQLGDEASGAWLGRALLARVLQAEDGVVDHSGVTRQALAAHGDIATNLVVFARGAGPHEFAALTHMLTAAPDDPAATALLRAGAGEITRALTALGWNPGNAVCLTGGIGPFYAPYLDAPTLPVQGTALDGALRLAAEQTVPVNTP